jgi:hypothetical protein
MTIEMGGPGIAGFGYGNQGNPTPRADNDQPGEVRPGNGFGQDQGVDHGPSAGAEPEEIAKEFTYERVPGFETSASDCINRARQIARSLNHATWSADHLMLALTMDQGARRLLERVGDVAQLRATAMRKLGKNYNKSDAADQAPTPTADLADIGKKARETANEREQLVSVSDLIAAFPKENGRLTYGAGEGSRAVAVIEAIETRVIPGVDNAVTRIENAIVDAIQRQHQSVQAILADLNSRQSHEWEQRQRDFMDEVRRQVREAADAQFGAALKDLNANFEKRLAEVKESSPQPVPPADPFLSSPPQEDPSPPKSPEPPKPSWGWLGMIL